jgi:hypothetical protein
MSDKNLKNSYNSILIIFIVWNVALFIVANNGFSTFWEAIGKRITEFKTEDSLFSLLTPLVLVIACGLLPTSWKATLVFWRLKNTLPGCRAFSELAKKDPRIDESLIGSQVNSKLNSTHEENAVWYKWYKAVQNQITVQESHRQFLLNRDLTGIAFLFFVFGSIALFTAGANLLNICIYSVLTLMQYFIFSLVARNHGNRFVCNVIVEYQNLK